MMAGWLGCEPVTGSVSDPYGGRSRPSSIDVLRRGMGGKR